MSPPDPARRRRLTSRRQSAAYCSRLHGRTLARHLRAARPRGLMIAARPTATAPRSGLSAARLFFKWEEIEPGVRIRAKRAKSGVSQEIEPAHAHAPFARAACLSGQFAAGAKAEAFERQGSDRRRASGRGGARTLHRTRPVFGGRRRAAPGDGADRRGGGGGRRRRARVARRRRKALRHVLAIAPSSGGVAQAQ